MRNGPFGNSNILFFPDYTGSNPYQSLLYEAIRNKIGISSTGFRDKKLFTKKFLSDMRNTCGILHLHWLDPFMDFRDDLVFYRFVDTVLYARELGYRIIWTVHNLVTHGNADEEKEIGYYEYFVQYVDVVLVHSNIAKDMVVALYKVEPNKVFVVPHGNYVSVYDNSVSRATAREILAIPEDEFVFLYFGMIRAYKGVEKLAEMFSILQKRHDKIKLLIVGKPRDTSIVNNIKSLGNENIVLVDRFIDDQEIQTYFNASDIVVLPFDRILTSGSTLLALSFHKPVIVPGKGVLPELIDNKVGYLFHEDEELVEIMEKNIQDWTCGQFSKKFDKDNFNEVLTNSNWVYIINKFFPGVMVWLQELPGCDTVSMHKDLEKKLKKERFVLRRVFVFFNRLQYKVVNKFNKSFRKYSTHKA